MLKGYSQPLTPGGTSSLVTAPPWHFVGNVLAIEYTANPEAVAEFLPERLNYSSNECCVYFIEWQYASETGEEHLDPIRSQYKETLFLLSAELDGEPISYCPFIWVDQDISMMRGLIQGWPKQLGNTWMTRASTLPSKAASMEGSGGRFGASLSTRDRRLAEARVTLHEQTQALPSPGFARAINLRHFPELSKSAGEKPVISGLVQLNSRDVAISTIWKGDALLEIMEHPQIELSRLKPLTVNAGYRFSMALTVDDLILLE